MSPSTNTIDLLALSSESTTDERISVSDTSTNSPRDIKRSTKSIESAVYAHIRAVRALGRDKINTADIAEALSIPVAEVNRAILSLSKRGVKTLNV